MRKIMIYIMEASRVIQCLLLDLPLHIDFPPGDALRRRVLIYEKDGEIYNVIRFNLTGNLRGTALRPKEFQGLTVEEIMILSDGFENVHEVKKAEYYGTEKG